jgi:hypothetical protein
LASILTFLIQALSCKASLAFQFFYESLKNEGSGREGGLSLGFAPFRQRKSQNEAIFPSQ